MGDRETAVGRLDGERWCASVGEAKEKKDGILHAQQQLMKKEICVGSPTSPRYRGGPPTPSKAILEDEMNGGKGGRAR